MVKELLEWEGWGLWRPRLPKSSEQDPGFEPGSDRTSRFGPRHQRSFWRLELLFFPWPFALLEALPVQASLGEVAEVEQPAALQQEIGLDNTTRCEKAQQTSCQCRRMAWSLLT